MPRFEGFDPSKQYDPRSPKGLFREVLQRLGTPHTLEGLQQAAPELSKAYGERFPGLTTTVSGDVLRFGGQLPQELGGLTEFDVVRASKAPGGGEAFQWLPAGEAAGDSYAARAASARNTGVAGPRYDPRLNYGPLESGLQQLTGRTGTLIDELLSGGSLDDSFIRELLRERVNR